ncbi:MAG: histidine phosphatase family protein [Lachnospiraceae bacterium]|jgi:broad specificity phosphatase PhoE|nr:histidine phosphatase family protein [Lachnospiraceae bacterium]
MLNIYLIRHGQTDMNITHMLQGRSDTVLNDTGRSEALQAKLRLDEMGIRADVVFSSPLERAYETAQIISGGSDCDILKDDRLIEMSFGQDEGKKLEDLPEDFLYHFRSDTAGYIPPEGGETFLEVRKRTSGFLRELHDTYSSFISKDDTGKNITIFVYSHGAAINSMLNFVNSEDITLFWDHRVGNASANLIQGVPYDKCGSGYKFIENISVPGAGEIYVTSLSPREEKPKGRGLIGKLKDIAR